MIWVGIDPGSKDTGVVARDGSTLLAWGVVSLAATEPGATRPGPVTFQAVEDVARELLTPDARVAVEDFLPPNPHVTRRNGRSTITLPDALNARQLIGWLQRAFPAAVLVDPDGNGSQLLAAYPRELITDREYANAVRKRTLKKAAPQNTVMRHARSAWDVAGTAAMADRLHRAAQRNH